MTNIRIPKGLNLVETKTRGEKYKEGSVSYYMHSNKRKRERGYWGIIIQQVYGVY